MRLLYLTSAIILVLSGAQAATPQRRGRADRVVQKPPLAVNPADIGNSNQPEFAEGSRGSGVVRAQILLDRAHFSCGQIDGDFGQNLRKTVAAFQSDRKLPVTGVVDAATWAALNGDKQPLLVPYTIVPADETGPFVTVPANMKKAAGLPYLGYASPLDELSERFHSSPELLKALNPDTDFKQAGRQITVPNVIMPPPGEAAQVVVTKSDSSVRAYDGSGKLLAFYMATIGSKHDPLPLGNWKIDGVKRNPRFHYNARLFWDARDRTAKAILKPGPRGPVGLVWIDLSKPHYGLHGTPDPGRIGHAYSHGCIRMTNWDAIELAAMVKPGTPAVLKE